MEPGQTVSTAFPKTGFLADDQQETSAVYLAAVNIFVLGLISIIGVVSNILNMIIFIRQGLKDSMTVELFGLAFTDFSVSVVELAITCTSAASVLCPWSPVDLWSLAYVSFAWAVNAEYSTSCCITTVVSVERCISVVWPFKVRRIFSRARSVLVIVLLYGLHVVLFVPAFVIEKMDWILLDPANHHYPRFNSSEGLTQKWFYTIIFSEATDRLDTTLDIANGLFMSVSSQLVIFVCSIWMTFSLKRSSTVRTKDLSVKDNFKAAQFNRPQLSKQEKKMTKVVLFLSLLHTVCNFPRLTITVYYHLYAWDNADDQRRFLTIVWPVMTFCSSVTCSSSICGYLVLNSKYRRNFLEIFYTERKLTQ